MSFSTNLSSESPSVPLIDSDSSSSTARELEVIIRRIQRSALTLEKLSSQKTPINFTKHHAVMESAQKDAEEAKHLLNVLANQSESFSNLRLDKLTSNYKTSLRTLEVNGQKIMDAERTQAIVSSARSIAQDQSPWIDNHNHPEEEPSEVADNYLSLPNSPKFVSNQRTTKIVQPVEDVVEVAINSEREEGIEQLHKDIQGIHKLYQELAMHVDVQGSDLDNIEYHMRSAEDSTQNATAEVRTAVAAQQASRRWCILGAALIISILVIGMFAVKV